MRRGLRDLAGADHERRERVRRPGAGRRRAEEVDPGLPAALDGLLEPRLRAGTAPPLRWTTTSTVRLAEALGRQGHVVSARTVARLLATAGYRLQGAANTRRAGGPAAREVRLRYFVEQAGRHRAAGQPVVGIEMFRHPHTGAAGPDTAAEPDPPAGWDAMTAAFAVAVLHLWWDRQPVRPETNRLAIGLDGRGLEPGGQPLQVWKDLLAGFAGPAALTITVCHLPDATRKWNGVAEPIRATLDGNLIPGPKLRHDVHLIPLTAITGGAETGNHTSLQVRRHDVFGVPENAAEWTYTIPSQQAH